MDSGPPIELLESTHTFPGVFQIKVIGSAADDFEARVLEVARTELATVGHLEHSVRTTPDGKHLSLTLDLNVQSAEQVRAIYAKIRDLAGLKFLL